MSGDITIGLDLNFVACIGFDVSIGLVFDIDNINNSGLFISGGFAAGVSFGASLFGGYNPGSFRDDNAGTISIGLGAVGGNVAFSSDGTVSGSLGGALPVGIDAGFNFSQQHGCVIPFATQEEKDKIMDKYWEHH